MTEAPGAGEHLRRHLPLVVAGGVLAVLYAPTLRSFHHVWTTLPNTHGYLVALGCVWLISQERGLRGRPWPAAMAVVTIGSTGWLLGRIADIQFAAQAAIPVIVLAWSAAVFGRHAAQRLAPIAAVFMTAVPIWAAAIPLLRMITVTVTYALLEAFGIPAAIDGTTIHIRYGTFFIRDACAGISFFVAGISLGALYAMGLVERLSIRLAVLSLAALLAMVANWIRVTSLIIIGHVSRMEAAVVYDHGTYGWAVFFVCVLLLFFPLAGILRRRSPRAAASIGSVSLAGSSAHEARDRIVPYATAAAAVGPLIYFAVGLVPASADIPEMPGIAPGWPSVEVERRAYDWRPGFSGADAEQSRSWLGQGQRRVTFDLLHYANQRQEAELIGYLNAIAPDSALITERLFGPVGPTRRYVNEAVVRDPSGPILVWYWYRVGGIETASPLKAKLLEIPAFFRRIASSELVAVSTACEPESCQAASATLRSFFGGET